MEINHVLKYVLDILDWTCLINKVSSILDECHIKILYVGDVLAYNSERILLNGIMCDEMFLLESKICTYVQFSQL